MKVFPCFKCGKCCMNLHLANETAFLDRGDGICLYFNIETKLCSVYAIRPLICRVDFQYEQNYRNKYTWDEFVQLNLEICHLLNQETALGLIR